MGFTINEEIRTILTYQDIALITVVMGMYQDRVGDSKDKQSTHARHLVSRLGREMSSYPKKDFTKNK